MELALERKDWSEVTALLRAVEKDAGLDWGDLKAIPAFGAYVETEDYERWLRSRKESPR